MIRKIFYGVIGLLTILVSCNPSEKKVEKEPVKPTVFNFKEVGWSLTLPTGFQLSNQQKLEESAKKGKEAISKVYNGEVNVDRLKHLISFQKNRANLFDSTIEPYDVKKSGNYEKNNQLLKKLVFDTYTNQKIKVDTASTETEISHQKFNVFEIKVYGPSGEVAMTQLMYSKLWKGYDFGITIIYNNEEDKNLMIDAVKKSTLN